MSVDSRGVKVFFRLQQDDDGYPPVAVEGLWARPGGTRNTVVLDNIPFYARGVAPGDEIEVASDESGRLWFHSLVKSSGSSVFRVYAINGRDVDGIRSDLLGFGLPSEVDLKVRLVAVEVPAAADIRVVLDYLINGQEIERFDFEEGALRHVIPD